MKSNGKMVKWVAALFSAFLLIAAAGCGNSESSGSDNDNEANASDNSGGDSNDKSGKIALLLPETGTSARYESQDKPDFEAAVKDLNPNMEVDYQNADGDAKEQQKQAESAITNGADVIVIDPYDSKAAATIVKDANEEDIPVISYDRLILNAKVDYYISFDNEKVGEIQGQYIADNTDDGGTVVMINGAPTDNNAKLFKKGAHNVLDPLFDDGTLKKGYESDTKDWDADEGQREMEQALTKLDNNVDGVLSANDGLAGAIIKALDAQGMAGNVPVTGQDATDDGLRNIILGDQSMTVYKDVNTEATAAAKLAITLASGEEPDEDTVNGKTDNEMMDVPSILLDPIAVTKDKIADTVIKDEYTSWDKICTGAAKDQCPDH